MASNFSGWLKMFLVKKNLLTEEQKKTADDITSKDKRLLSEVLITNKFIEEETLLALIAREARIPPINVEKVLPDEAALKMILESQAHSYGVLPVSKIGDILTIAVSNPFDILKIDDLKIITGCDIRYVVALDFRIAERIRPFYNPEELAMEKMLEENEETDEVELTKHQMEDVDVASLTAAGEDAPIVKFVNLIIYKALEEGASDIHIEPYENMVAVRYRKDGVLHEAMQPPKKIFNAIISRVKVMTSLDIAERRVPQDGKFQIKYENRQIDFRVSTLPTIYGEKVVMRVLDSSSINLGLDVLGFEPQAMNAFKTAIMAPYGMILVTGPTGSGKSTTLYSALKAIMSNEDNIMTVEDPVEYQLEGVGQVPINQKRGMTFALALRSLLRQDPDKIMVGEIRDGETADIAVKAAMTGHLVLSTLHTNDAASAITRLADMGVDPFLIASSTILLSAQRLARKLCERCKQPFDPLPPPERLINIGFKEAECKNIIYKPVGCAHCRDGYKGRFAFLEALEIDDEVRRMIIKSKSVFEIKKYAVDKGMITLRRCGVLNILKGKTSIEEVLRMTEA
ncbi:MAG: type IV-A pilus assembly ATPase PilB [Planctomycetes bacterium]|nr:type IV-A pilus assembly ATPase PilB [Planctomycetota bacterium]